MGHSPIPQSGTYITSKQKSIWSPSRTDTFKATHSTLTHSCQGQFYIPMVWVSVLCNLLWHVLMVCVLFGALPCLNGMSFVLFDAMSQWYVLCTFCVYALMVCIVYFLMLCLVYFLMLCLVYFLCVLFDAMSCCVLFVCLPHKSPPPRWTHHRSNRNFQ